MAGRLSLLGAGKQTVSAGTSAEWWSANVVPIDNCLAAYQAKGAADYAASKVNLVNPATYGLTDGSYYPTWNNTGWTFASNTSWCRYLVTTLTPTSSWTIIARYSNNTASAQSHIIGTKNDDNKMFSMAARSWLSSAHNHWWQATATANDDDNTASGVIALAGIYGYHDGALAVTLSDSQSVTYQYPFFIGTFNNKGTMLADTGIESVVEAVAFYNATLTGTQIAALTTAMNAL